MLVDHPLHQRELAAEVDLLLRFFHSGLDGRETIFRKIFAVAPLSAHPHILQVLGEVVWSGPGFVFERKLCAGATLKTVEDIARHAPAVHHEQQLLEQPGVASPPRPGVSLDLQYAVPGPELHHRRSHADSIRRVPVLQDKHSLHATDAHLHRPRDVVQAEDVSDGTGDAQAHDAAAVREGVAVPRNFWHNVNEAGHVCDGHGGGEGQPNPVAHLGPLHAVEAPQPG
mmetsp:Transcript_44084/g.86453  ORF Transcript_44084/g.86453 Transcript_44084/m.86453 type:complete len:227 (-) Transcript_44084:147-827(-)|eukprot:CAMPEP_0194343978 /NCGR_PEP_ID=MMETSP0171-20130528/99447_1 /TAXON_ID=218684 /ORGANISM="Corethron pennatum, Strain L29A3" /LENGTH=226 /DNA_ID=CAMNT_0039110447 /DNA_START=155 /DNA_END=835 /DNA_ORIENTATION=+